MHKNQDLQRSFKENDENSFNIKLLSKNGKPIKSSKASLEILVASLKRHFEVDLHDDFKEKYNQIMAEYCKITMLPFPKNNDDLYYFLLLTTGIETDVDLRRAYHLLYENPPVNFSYGKSENKNYLFFRLPIFCSFFAIYLFNICKYFANFEELPFNKKVDAALIFYFINKKINFYQLNDWTVEDWIEHYRSDFPDCYIEKNMKPYLKGGDWNTIDTKLSKVFKRVDVEKLLNNASDQELVRLIRKFIDMENADNDEPVTIVTGLNDLGFSYYDFASCSNQVLSIRQSIDFMCSNHNDMVNEHWETGEPVTLFSLIALNDHGECFVIGDDKHLLKACIINHIVNNYEKDVKNHEYFDEENPEKQIEDLNFSTWFFEFNTLLSNIKTFLSNL